MKAKRVSEESLVSVDDEPRPQSHAMTYVNRMQSRIATGLLVAVVAIALVAVASFTVISLTRSPTVLVESDAEIDYAASSLAGSRGSEVVSAWLGASRGDSADLKRLYAGTVPELPELPSVFANVSPAEVTLFGATWRVVVGADVQVREPGEKDSGVQRLYFQVPVRVEGELVEVMALPSVVSGPVVASGSSLAYSSQVYTDSPLGVSVSEFLTALVAGQGDVHRYLTPGTPGISAITPAPYTSVVVSQIRSAQEVDAESPDDGATVEILVNVQLVRGDGGKVSSQYALAMTARGGRWEVSAISPGPATAEPSSTPSAVKPSAHETTSIEGK